ncbi:MAG: MarR family transcriptional regulator [Erysipelotrichaceae bacterium]|nr:MarR family transcriptional regulator [Erysipelotrichaceae bacterium]
MDRKELNYKFRRIGQLRHWHISSMMKSFDSIYYGQIHLLDYITMNPGCTQKDLADFFASSKATITKSIKRMLANGIIYRKTNEEDERKFALYPTELGEQLSSRSQDIFRQVGMRCYQGFSEEELQQLDGYITRIVNNLETDYSRGKSGKELIDAVKKEEE